jgi:DNA-binding beta-propeller fold protein YncE
MGQGVEMAPSKLEVNGPSWRLVAVTILETQLQSIPAEFREHRSELDDWTSAGDYPHQIAISHRTNELFVVNNVAYTVSVYDRVSGVLKRKIAGSSTGPVRPTGVAIDELNGEVYIANDCGNSVTVYDLLASGDVPPKRTITSPAIGSPVGLAVDPVNNEGHRCKLRHKCDCHLRSAG